MKSISFRWKAKDRRILIDLCAIDEKEFYLEGGFSRQDWDWLMVNSFCIYLSPVKFYSYW